MNRGGQRERALLISHHRIPLRALEKPSITLSLPHPPLRPFPLLIRSTSIRPPSMPYSLRQNPKSTSETHLEDTSELDGGFGRLLNNVSDILFHIDLVTTLLSRSTTIPFPSRLHHIEQQVLTMLILRDKEDLSGYRFEVSTNRATTQRPDGGGG